MAEQTENKVQFNLKNFHYATFGQEGASPTWNPPVSVPGSVSLTLNQVGEIKKFYADGIIYWQGANNNGYEGEIEIARVPEQMYEDIWGQQKTTTDEVLIENTTDKAKNYAALFQIDGDQTEQYYCLYNCTSTRPGIEAKTNEEAKEPMPQKLSFSSAPLADGTVKAATTSKTTEEVKTGWFDAVYDYKSKMPAKAAAAAEQTGKA